MVTALHQFDRLTLFLDCAAAPADSAGGNLLREEAGRIAGILISGIADKLTAGMLNLVVPMRPPQLRVGS